MQEDTSTQEVRTTEEQVGNTNIQRQTVSQAQSVPASVVMKRIIWFVVGFIVAMLALRVILFLFGASEGSGFVSFIYNFTGIFTMPFNGIFPVPAYGRFGIDTAALVAMVIYSLVGWGIGALMDLGKPAGTSQVD